MACASRSLPVPVSPRIITGMSLPETLRSLWITAETCGSPVSRYCSVERWGLREATLATACEGVAAACSSACCGVTGMVRPAFQGLAALTFTRHHTATPLCSTSCLGVGRVPLNRSISEEIGIPNSEEKVWALRAANGRPI